MQGHQQHQFISQGACDLPRHLHRMPDCSLYCTTAGLLTDPALMLQIVETSKEGGKDETLRVRYENLQNFLKACKVVAQLAGAVHT